MTVHGPVTMSSSAHVLFQEYLSLHYPTHPVYKTSPVAFDMSDPTRLSQLYDQPFLHPLNLSFQSLDQVYRECSYLLRPGTTTDRTMILVDCIESSMTTDEESRHAFLSSLSSRFKDPTSDDVSRLQIIRSTRFPMTDDVVSTPDVIASRLEHSLVYEHAGIIGPVELSLDKGNDALVLFQGIARVQAKLGVPVVLTAGYQPLGSQHEQDSLALLYQYQAMVQSCQTSAQTTHPTFKGILAQAQYWSLEGLTCVLKKGWNVCFDGIGLHRSVSRQDPFRAPTGTTTTSSSSRSEAPPTDDALAEKIALLVQRNFSSQIVLSNGLRMRTQWRKHGGGGYSFIYTSFLVRLERDFDLSADVLTGFIQTNPLRLLQWYQPQTADVEIPKDYIQCDICAKAFEPIEGKYYSKFTFTYCSLGCLRKHLKMKFAPLDK